MIDYFHIIQKYIDPTSPLYRIYLIHVSMVAAKALKTARKLQLSTEQQQFIEEAAMLHDIGITRVQFEPIGCHGELPYICHGPEGRRILEAEGLPRHAQVAEHHTGVGITKEEIIKYELPIPQRDMLAETLEEEIISWADLYYGKNPANLWQERSPARIRQQLSQLVDAQTKIERFEAWIARFDD
jgi:uncharacterized protein